MIPSFNIQAGESPAAVSERRKIAMALMREGMDTSPIRSPWQGAARVAQAMMGGMEMNRADQSERDAGKRLADALVPMSSGGGAGVAPASAPSMPRPASGAPMASDGVSRVAAALTSPQSAPVKDVYDANEQSPLDPVPGAITPDRARLLAALQPGESGGRPNVMYGGKTFDSFADHPRQAQPIMGGPNAGQKSTAAGTYQIIAPTWDRAQKALNLPDFSPGNQNAAAVQIAGEDYQKRTGQDLDAALSQAGQDPAKIAAIGKALSPTWTSLPGGIEPNQQTNQFVRNMQAPATEFSAQARQQPVPQQPAAIPDPARNAPQIPAEMQARLRSLIMDPSTRDYGMQLASQYMRPSQAQFVQIGEDDMGNKRFGFVDNVSQKITPYQETAAPGSPPAAPRTITGPDGRPVQVLPGQDPKEFRKKLTEASAEYAGGAGAAKLRKEVQDLPSYKNIAQAAPVYKSMLDAAGRDNRAADVNLIYGMAKIMDPGSVVRESEMTVAQAVATLPQQLRATIESQLNSTGRLSPEVRQAIMQEAHSRVGSYQQMFNQDAGMYHGIADRYRMHREDIVPSFGEFPKYTAPAAPIASAAPAGQQSIDMLLQKYGGQRG